MSRRLSLVVATLATAVAAVSCNNPTCGPGTKQQQSKDGTVQCVAVDAMPSTIPCDTDGGATIVGGQCVSAVKCDPKSTMLVNGVCVGIAGGGDTPPPCTPPSSNTLICINGAIHNVVDGKLVTDTIHVAYYSSPFNFLMGKAPDKEIDTATGTFVLSDVMAPSVGVPLLALAFGDADVATTNAGTTYVATATGAQGIQGGKSYRIDGYALKRAVLDSWSTQTGVDWFARGAYVARYYSDPKSTDPTNVAATESHPVSGVTMTAGASGTSLMPLTPPSAFYFGADLSTIDKALTATGAAGAAISPAPPMGSAYYSGSGGGITWELETGGSAPKVLFVSRFHPGS